MPPDGSHFHDWIDSNLVAFSKEVLEWGRKDRTGQDSSSLFTVSKRTRMFIQEVKSKVFFI